VILSLPRRMLSKRQCG